MPSHSVMLIMIETKLLGISINQRSLNLKLNSRKSREYGRMNFKCFNSARHWTSKSV